MIYMGEIQMNFIKNNLITIILIMLIIVIVSIISIFCWKIIQVENQSANTIIADNISTIDNNYSPSNSNENVTNNSEIKENITVSNKSYINMSKYYLDSNLGKTAEIYNKMLDVLGSQSYISYLEQDIYSDGTYNQNYELDLKNNISKYEGEDSGGKSISYKYWRGTKETKYNYYESRGTWKKSTFNWYAKADIIYSFMGSKIIMIHGDEYEFSYEENISRNNSSYYKLTAIYSGDDAGKKEEIIMYIEMDTMKLKEVEITSETTINSNLVISGQNNYYFEYSDKVLEIPEEILNMQI